MGYNELMTTYRLDIEINTEDGTSPTAQTEGTGIIDCDVVADATYVGRVPTDETDPTAAFPQYRYESGTFDALVNVAANVVGYDGATAEDLHEAFNFVAIQHMDDHGQRFATTTFERHPGL